MVHSWYGKVIGLSHTSEFSILYCIADNSRCKETHSLSPYVALQLQWVVNHFLDDVPDTSHFLDLFHSITIHFLLHIHQQNMTLGFWFDFISYKCKAFNSKHKLIIIPTQDDIVVESNLEEELWGNAASLGDQLLGYLRHTSLQGSRHFPDLGTFSHFF